MDIQYYKSLLLNLGLGGFLLTCNVEHVHWCFSWVRIRDGVLV